MPTITDRLLKIAHDLRAHAPDRTPARAQLNEITNALLDVKFAETYIEETVAPPLPALGTVPDTSQ